VATHKKGKKFEVKKQNVVSRRRRRKKNNILKSFEETFNKTLKVFPSLSHYLPISFSLALSLSRTI
jgi:hypothetical protein